MFQSKRLIYRAAETPEDDAFLLSMASEAEAIGNSDPALLRPPTRKAAEASREYHAKSLISVIMCLKPTSPTATPVPIGQINLMSVRPTTEHHRHSEIGINIVTAYHGQGYGSEAIKWILNWGFNMAGLHRIAIGCFSWNEGAARLYERLGFVPEGRSREVFWFNGKWGDAINFGMLEHEWRALQAKEEKVNGEGSG